MVNRRGLCGSSLLCWDPFLLPPLSLLRHVFLALYIPTCVASGPLDTNKRVYLAIFARARRCRKCGDGVYHGILEWRRGTLGGTKRRVASSVQTTSFPPSRDYVQMHMCIFFVPARHIIHVSTKSTDHVTPTQCATHRTRQSLRSGLQRPFPSGNYNSKSR